jgi:UDP-glucose 4-epimerase
MKKIFITGIAGFLGSHLADYFLSKGYCVSGNDNLIGGDISNVSQNVKFYNFDCCDFENMKNALQGVDIVIHAAATAHEGFSVFSPNFITRNIYQATVSTISSAIANNVKRFVFCSSMARYGNQSGPFCETMIPAPVDPYGIAKVASESTLIMLSNLHGMEWNIAVPHNIVGPKQKYDDPYRNVMSIMINRALKGQPAVIYGDGNQVRCFSYIDDCVDCLYKMATDPNIFSEVINIGPDEEFISINQLAEIIHAKAGINETPVYVNPRPTEVKHAVCSSNKARRLLGYNTTTTLIEAVDQTFAWIKNTGTKQFKYNFDIEINNDLVPETWKNKII